MFPTNWLSFLTFLILFISLPSKTKAEYRVYQYSVKPKGPQGMLMKSYFITSTLDTVSYLAYHGGRDSLDISLLRTWICPGYTGKLKALCPGPYQELSNSLNPKNEAKSESKNAE